MSNLKSTTTHIYITYTQQDLNILLMDVISLHKAYFVGKRIVVFTTS